MTWSISHRQAWATAADYDALWTYMWDTYLAGKGWTVGAGSDAYSRFVSYDVINAWTGLTETRNWIVDWDSGTGAQCNVYAAHTNASTFDVAQAAYTTMDGSQTEVLFWDSTEDPNAALVTVGPSMDFYWPGDSARWFLRGDPVNGLSDSTTVIMPAASGSWKYFGWQADPDDTTASNRYRTIGYVGFMGEDLGEQDNPAVPVGAKQMRVKRPILGIADSISLAGSNTKTYNNRGPICQLTTTDTFLQFGATASARSGRLYMPSQLGTDGTNYFLGVSNTSNYLTFDCGTTEPTF